MLKLLSYLVPLVFEFVCTLYDCMVYFLFHQRYNSQTVTYMWYFDFDKLGDSCYFYVIFDIFMGDILKCCDEVIFCRRGSNMIWMAIDKYCTCMCVCILFFNNLIWFESCNLIGWSAWRKFLVILDNLGWYCGVTNIFIGQRQIQIVMYEIIVIEIEESLNFVVKFKLHVIDV